jgi:hypothetical protein
MDLTVIRLNGTRFRRHLRTLPNQFLSPAGEGWLKKEADRVEQFFPGLEFRLVPLRGGNFNFVEIKPELATETV